MNTIWWVLTCKHGWHHRHTRYFNFLFSADFVSIHFLLFFFSPFNSVYWLFFLMPFIVIPNTPSFPLHHLWVFIWLASHTQKKRKESRKKTDFSLFHLFAYYLLRYSLRGNHIFAFGFSFPKQEIEWQFHCYFQKICP